MITSFTNQFILLLCIIAYLATELQSVRPGRLYTYCRRDAIISWLARLQIEHWKEEEFLPK